MRLVLIAVAMLAFPASARVLVSAAPIAAPLAGTDAYTIRYRSEGAVLTGTAVLPRGAAPAAGRPIVAWTHGTVGIAEHCAPSLSPQPFGNVPGLASFIQRGYGVVAPDYAGLGSPGPHPYLIGGASARATLDAVRALREIRPGLSPRVVIWGESQGAHAALWTARLAAYAPELRILGVAAAAPPTDLAANLGAGSNPYVRAFLSAYALSSWSAVYRVPLSTILRPPAQAIVHRLAANCVTLEPVRLRAKIGLAVLARAMKRVDLATVPVWSPIVARNSLPADGWRVPLFIAQEDGDPIVGAAVTRAFVGRVCRAGGTPLRYVALPGGNHIDTASRVEAAAVTWIAGRFAAQPAPTDCGALSAPGRPLPASR